MIAFAVEDMTCELRQHHHQCVPGRRQAATGNIDLVNHGVELKRADTEANELSDAIKAA